MFGYIPKTEVVGHVTSLKGVIEKTQPTLFHHIKDPSQRLLCLNVFDKMRYETVPMESRHSFFAFLLKSDIFRLQFGQITSLELFSL